MNAVNKISKITSVKFPDILESEGDAKEFTLLRTWILSRPVLNSSTAPLELLNIGCPVSDADLALEDIFISLYVSNHLHIGTQTLLKGRHDRLDGRDCAEAKSNNHNEMVVRLGRHMISRIKRVANCAMNVKNKTGTTQTPPKREVSVNHYAVQDGEDPFMGNAPLDLLCMHQTEAEAAGIKRMIQNAEDKNLSLR